MNKKLAIFSFGLFSVLIFFAIAQNGNNVTDKPTVSATAEIPSTEIRVTPEPTRTEKLEDERSFEKSFSFAVLGDTQRFEPGHQSGDIQSTVKQLNEMQPNFIVALGDLVGSCDAEACQTKLKSWKEQLGQLISKTYVVMGNHDRTDKEASDEAWQKNFEMPHNGPTGFEDSVYSFDFANSHFVILNSVKPQENAINDVQLTWLQQDLSNNQNKKNFVFVHEPAFPVNHKIDSSLDAEPKQRDQFWNLLQQYQVTAVFAGHEHLYARSKIQGVNQIIVGNTASYPHPLPLPGKADFGYEKAGFAMVTVSDDQVQLKFFTVAGQLIDTFNL